MLPAWQPGLTLPLGTPSKTTERVWGYSCRTIHSGPTIPTPSLFSPSDPGRKKELGRADGGGDSVAFSFGYILKAKVSWTYSQNGWGGGGEGRGWGWREAALLSPPPQEHVSTWGGGPSVSCFPPPTAPNKRRSPLPQGQLPPQPGLYIQWFSAVLWLRGVGGEVARQSRSLSWTVAVTGSTGHSGTHSLCHLFFGSAQIYQSHHPIRNIPPNQKLKTGSSVSPSDSHVCFPVSCVAPALSPLLGPRAVPRALT